MRVVFTREALASANAKQTWWEANRQKAPDLFVEELVEIVTKLRAGADEERQQYAVRGGHMIWRLLMPKTRHHVYYQIDEAKAEVEILLIWNAVARTPPTF